MPKPETLLARIKPFAPRKGLVLRSYTHHDGTMFNVEKGWYEVTLELGEELARVNSRVGDDSSPLAFDVCTPEQAHEINETERRAMTQSAAPSEPIRVSRPYARPNEPSSVVLGGEDPSTPGVPGAPRRRGGGARSSEANG